MNRIYYYRVILIFALVFVCVIGGAILFSQSDSLTEEGRLQPSAELLTSIITSGDS